jgi:hypothetical protein
MTTLVNHWTAKDDAELRLLRASGMRWVDIGEAMGRTCCSVKQRFYALKEKAGPGGRPKGSITQCRRHPMGQDPCIGLFCKELPREQRRKVNRKAGYFLCESCRKGCASVYDGRA